MIAGIGRLRVQPKGNWAGVEEELTRSTIVWRLRTYIGEFTTVSMLFSRLASQKTKGISQSSYMNFKFCLASSLSFFSHVTLLHSSVDTSFHLLLSPVPCICYRHHFRSNWGELVDHGSIFHAA